MRSRRILILGGTREARALADLISGQGAHVVTSLAGVTREPAQPAGEVRRGGFGGVDGLANYLIQEKFAAVVDATHPFAAQISRHAAEAAAKCGVPIVRLERPPWQARPGDQWIGFADLQSAAAALPENARVLLTVGRKEVAAFFERSGISGVARMIEQPAVEPPANWKLLLARPPFALADELSLLDREAVTIVVAKNSGGDETRAKIDAARERGIPVHLIQRPLKPAVAAATTAEEVVDHLRRHQTRGENPLLYPPPFRGREDRQ